MHGQANKGMGRDVSLCFLFLLPQWSFLKQRRKEAANVAKERTDSILFDGIAGKVLIQAGERESNPAPIKTKIYFKSLGDPAKQRELDLTRSKANPGYLPNFPSGVHSSLEALVQITGVEGLIGLSVLSA